MKTRSKPDLFRLLPSVDELLRRPDVAPLVAREGQAAVTDATRAALTRLREEISRGALDAKQIALAVAGIAAAIERELRDALAYSLNPVINATGVILHTNLGRAPLSAHALDRVREVGAAYSNLEFHVEAGERGKRDIHADRLFARLLNREGVADVASVVVNNNAAAVLLALNTLAEGGEVVVSRGELVEIGGAFRVPDVMAKAGATLREVGTTNRTRIADYERAVTERTRLLLRVHRSNFQIVGFTEQPALEELVALGRKRGIPVMEDLGSGALFDLETVGVSGEPTVHRSLRAGVDLVTYSGDKLLGGPQAGILSGRPELVARVRSDPLFRALRVDKMTYAALESTLMSYLKQDYDAVPALHMMRTSPEDIARRAEAVAKATKTNAKLEINILDGESVIGGGAAPGATLKTRLLAVTCEGLSADELAARLRSAATPIVTRVEEGRVLLDLRTVFPEKDSVIADTLRRIAP